MPDKYTVVTYYKFVPIDNPEEMRGRLMVLCQKNNIKGTILVAKEGINATTTGTTEDVENFMISLKKIDEFNDIEYKVSIADFNPFHKMKVKVKNEIVALKKDLDMSKTEVGEYLASDKWDEMIDNKDVILIDMRNYYEVTFGSFENAINPRTQNFSDFPAWFEKNIDMANKEQKIAMFCTGGVRCEKSTAYVKQLGFKHVYHLKGGILKYLEDKKGMNSKWNGDLFLFDDRIAVNSNLEPTSD